MQTIIENLKQHLEAVGDVDIAEHGCYTISLKAAFMKAFEYVEMCSAESGWNPYFSLGGLRGICEDYIVLAFYQSLEKGLRDEVISCHIAMKFAEGTKRQKAFFESERPFQPVISTSNAEQKKEEARRRLKEIATESQHWNPKEAIPKINWMAKSLGLEDFYQFYYCISSESVHFNAKALVRMGWGDDKEKFNFSTNNFAGYYNDFCRIYGAVMLQYFLESFHEELGLPDEVRNLTKKLTTWLHEHPRWPEPVTYEEMNLKSPSTFERIAMRIAHEES